MSQNNKKLTNSTKYTHEIKHNLHITLYLS